MKIPAAFVDRVEADGFLQMGIDPENNAMMKHVMRKAIINALPGSEERTGELSWDWIYAEN